MPQFEYLMTYHADLNPPSNVGQGPAGTRQIHDVSGGWFEGPRLKGKILPSGADWLLIGPDGIGRLDVRATFETDDGAHIYLQYEGILSLNEKIQRAMAEGGETQYGDTYFFTQPRFETGDERYSWLNSIVTVGEGRTLPRAVEYRLYQITNDPT